MAGTVTASVIKNDTTSPPAFQNSAGTEVGQLARAWVNFNGTTSPGTIRASFNVSSVTKSSTGIFTINLTNALADANYNAVFGAKRINQTANISGAVAETFTTAVRTSSALSITVMDGNAGFVDSDFVSVTFFR